MAVEFKLAWGGKKVKTVDWPGPFFWKPVFPEAYFSGNLFFGKPVDLMSQGLTRRHTTDGFQI